MAPYAPAKRPTFYFIGVTTGSSSIRKVFPAWANFLGLDGELVGIDFPLHANPASYRAAVEFIRADPLSVGALVTTHKLDLFKASRDLFDEIDPHAAFLHEVSCISKRADRLIGHAKDPISSGLAIDGFLPTKHFARAGAEVFAIGAGGSTVAITWHLLRGAAGNVPARIVISDTNRERLDEHARIYRRIETDAHLAYVLTERAEDNDAVVAGLKPGSLVINATGLGKDTPGSPLSDAVRFPDRAIVWDLNYRGDLIFLEQARRREREYGLQLEDGWTYFIYGWTQVISEVFRISLPESGERFDALARIASDIVEVA